MSNNPESENPADGAMPPPPPTAAQASATPVSPESTPTPAFSMGNLNLGNDDDDSANSEGDSEFGPEEDMPPQMMRRITYLLNLHETTKKSIEDAYFAERAALESKYQSQFREIHNKRAKVIKGEMDAVIDEEFKKEGGVIDAATDGPDKIVGCPQFWVCAMSQEETVAETLSEEDVDAMEYLSDVKCDSFADGCGFTLSFHFAPNPYFTNDVLTKTYTIPNLLTEDDPLLDKVEGCEIVWNKGKSLTQKEVTKKQRSKGGKKAGQIRTVTKMERIESFFHFFSPLTLSENMDEEEAEAMEEAFDRDYDLAQAFRIHLIPDAIAWFTGEANDDGEEGEEMNGESMEGEEEEGEEEESDEEGEESVQTFAGNNGGKDGIPKGAAGEGENPECKQN